MSHWYDSMILLPGGRVGGGGLIIIQFPSFQPLEPFYTYRITKHILRLSTDPTAPFPLRGYGTKETGRWLCNVCTSQRMICDSWACIVVKREKYWSSLLEYNLLPTAFPSHFWLKIKQTKKRCAIWSKWKMEAPGDSLLTNPNQERVS